MTNLHNFRIEFGFNVIENAEDGPEEFYEIISFIKIKANDFGIPFIWHFYEPHVEITWLSNKEKGLAFIEIIKPYLKELSITQDYRIKYPEDGYFADWWGRNQEENEFGGKIHALCSDFVDTYNNYKLTVDTGKGLRKQVERTIHRLCNPLGIGYWEEAKLCFSRGLICLLFTLFSFDRAVWIYRNIFRQTY